MRLPPTTPVCCIKCVVTDKKLSKIGCTIGKRLNVKASKSSKVSSNIYKLPRNNIVLALISAIRFFYSKVFEHQFPICKIILKKTARSCSFAYNVPTPLVHRPPKSIKFKPQCFSIKTGQLFKTR